MRKAVIDIGSNTINVLIAEVNGVSWKKIEEFKNPARLAKGGINKNVLASEAIERGITALTSHINIAKEYGCEEVIAYATAAVRDASNKDTFLNRVKSELHLDINVISGDREAELIAFGIRASGALNDESNLIIDIGGGSTEFIIIHENDILFKKSYRLGVTRLLEQFEPEDPLTDDIIAKITDHISHSTKDLYNAINKFKPSRLVGASGSFDSLAQMSCEMNGKSMSNISNELPRAIYQSLAKECLSLNYEGRSKIKGLALYRVETIPMAIIIINHVLSIGNIKDIYQSSYALKEGVIEEMYTS